MGPLSYMRSVADQNVAMSPTALLAKIFVFCILFCVKNKCSSHFSCSLQLLYTLLLLFHTSLQANKFWHQKHILLFVMGEAPVSHI